ncbi:MAG: gliding motility-associated ABC transporter ATP-binding subunit GldA [Candidatus Fluviicola riflensis]|nr:MAG: gliding motility-associated ABC transporter ATP-binding subunit GldA [Candidatus Fluviicola riflensis]OGS76867.1 MAG: gliding motility-associated ABC transporter ATP-binding subunit GldA [Candidatus Fluviicola riflensis]OGS81797.1 MAG: gliding motility-associated ABC transporter ATP-binding subunit GldA [Fluviicola sp. RIFCSPHIGHO2_01_FULL_43_53]OGS88596.1 MAG: gliding motility-associated ABC transporter ATP-binding subunit GldA [Fluviicola sp. RIFCSPHIGHO2_12_FULL_43_24]
MSIEVKNLTKYYGAQAAVNDISFSVGKGEIVGFLGPNGAGKSTTMKIITGFIPATEGLVNVCGMSVEEQSLETRKRIGYLPENNPLYLDMYVKEYLEFVAKIYKMDKVRDRVKDMINLVGLDVEQNKKIGMLSKGYRQRVGLAQAIIHNPDVLILDEPTSGLDPNQLVEIRQLIKTIGKEKTVMLSTHIMQEVEAICDRVIIIKKGKIVADNSASELQHEVGQQVIYAEFDGAISKNVLQKIPGVSKVQKVTDTTFLIESQGTEDLRKLIAIYAQQNNLLLITLRIEEKSLEEVFKELTR